MKNAAEYEGQWEECVSVEQMNVVFSRVIRGYSALEDTVMALRRLISDIHAMTGKK